MKTVVGMVCDHLGVSSGTELVQGQHGPETRMQVYATPACAFRSVQPAWVGIDYAHDENFFGEIVHLERDKPGRLWAVGEVSDSFSPAVTVVVGDTRHAVETPMFWSAKTSALGDIQRRDVQLLAVAITPSPRQLGLRQNPLTFLDGRLDHRGAPSRWSGLPMWKRHLLERAAETSLRRKAGEPLVIADLAPVERNTAQTYARSARLEVRSASAVDVSRALREVDAIVAPAEQPTTIYERTRSYVETFSHGCFAGCETDPHRVKVNRDHEISRLIGRALRLDPWSEEGCVGTFKIAKTPLGDETLALLDDGLLGVSAGFQVPPSGEEWRGDQRRIRKARLHHVAFAADPAYETATVLGVRSGYSAR